LRLFAQLRLDLHIRMMEAFVWEVGPETEELATRFRNGRLRDHGIPDLDEAIGVYQYLDEKNFYALDEKPSPEPAEQGYAAPRFALAERDKKSLIDKVIARLRKATFSTACCRNWRRWRTRSSSRIRSTAATRSSYGSAVGKVKAVVNMGLEILAGDDVGKATKIVQTRRLIHVFQIGYGKASILYTKAKAFKSTGWMKKTPEAIELLGTG